MTAYRIACVLAEYRQIFFNRKIVPKRETEGGLLEEHLLWMCGTAADYALKGEVDKGALEKAFRWLGFIQGAMWVLELRTVDEMRRDNAPPDEEFRERT